MTRLRAIVLALVLAGAATGIATAFWAAPGAGSATGSIGTLDAPADVVATPTYRSVALSWDAVTAPDASTPVTYVVTRGDETITCESATATSCTDSFLPSSTAYTYTVTAVWRSWSSESSVDTATRPGLHHYDVTTNKSSAAAGEPISVTITAKDASGDTVSDYRGSVSWESNDHSGSAVLPSFYTFVEGDNSSKTFTDALAFATAGSRTITARHPFNYDQRGSASVTVTHGPATEIELTAPTTEWMGDSNLVFTATITDAWGNTVTTGDDSAATMNFSVDGTGSLDAPDDLATASSGVATKTFTAHTAGSVNVVAGANLSGGHVDSNVLTFQVRHGAASQIALTSSGDVASGSTRTLRATIKDAAGNTVTTGPDATRSVSFAKTSGDGTVTNFAGSATTSAGVATLDVTGVTAGSITIEASATLSAGVKTSPLTFSVTHGPASQMVLTGSTANFTSQTQRDYTATLRDAAGNTVTSGTDASKVVGFSRSGTGSLMGFSGSATASNGVATYTAVAATAGPVTLQAAVTLAAGSRTSSLSFTVVPGPAKDFVIRTAITSPTAGATNNLTVQATDGINIATSYTGSHSLVFSGAAASPSGHNPTVANGSGTATSFGAPTTLNFTDGQAAGNSVNNGVMRIYKAGSATISATDADGIGTRTSATVNVRPGTTRSLTFTSASSSCGAAGIAVANGATWTSKVSIVDQFLNPAPSSGTTTVTVSRSPVVGTLSPTSLSIFNAANETSSAFTFTAPATGNYNTTISASATGLTSATCAVKRQ